jgi:hypothetical protein
MEVMDVVLLIQWVRGFNPSSAHGVTSPLLYEFFTSLRGEVWADKTSLSPPFFIEVSVRKRHNGYP